MRKSFFAFQRFMNKPLVSTLSLIFSAGLVALFVGYLILQSASNQPVSYPVDSPHMNGRLTVTPGLNVQYYRFDGNLAVDTEKVVNMYLKLGDQSTTELFCEQLSFDAHNQPNVSCTSSLNSKYIKPTILYLASKHSVAAVEVEIIDSYRLK